MLQSKRIVCVLIVICMLLCMLAGCGQEAGGASFPNGEEPVIDTEFSPIYFAAGTKPDYAEGIKINGGSPGSEGFFVTVNDTNDDYSKVGIYSAVVEVADDAGNTVSLNRNAAAVEPEWIDSITRFSMGSELSEMLDEILSECTSGNMDVKSKVYAVYRWMFDNLQYKADYDYDGFLDDVSGSAERYALDLLSDRKGACFAYASLFDYFMNKLNVPVIQVIGGGLNEAGGFELHCWSMINIGSGWTHCDPLYAQLSADVVYMDYFWMAESKDVYGSFYTWELDDYPWE